MTGASTSDGPSSWVRRFLPLVPAGGPVLDIACGGGRHTRLALAAGHPVVAVDIDLSGVADLAGAPGVELVEADLEDAPWPLPGQRFAAVVVTRYLHRPLLPTLVGAVAPGGLLLYETFAEGQEALGRPRDPRFLLRPGELLTAVRDELRVLAYEDLRVDEPGPAVLQRICARRPPGDPPGGLVRRA